MMSFSMRKWKGNRLQQTVANWILYFYRIKALYQYYKQAEKHEGDYEPLLVFKSDHKKELAVVDLAHFIKLTSYNNPERKQNEETKN